MNLEVEFRRQQQRAEQELTAELEQRVAGTLASRWEQQVEELRAREVSRTATIETELSLDVRRRVAEIASAMQRQQQELKVSEQVFLEKVQQRIGSEEKENAAEAAAVKRAVAAEMLMMAETETRAEQQRAATP